MSGIWMGAPSRVMRAVVAGTVAMAVAIAAAWAAGPGGVAAAARGGVVETYKSAPSTKIGSYARAVPIKVPDDFEVGDVDISVRLRETPGPVGNDEQLIVLMSPAGEAVQLTYGGTSPYVGPNDCGPGAYYTFDDEGSNQPDQPLSDLDGSSAKGTWTLFFQRVAGGSSVVGCSKLALQNANTLRATPRSAAARATKTATYVGATGAVPEKFDDPPEPPALPDINGFRGFPVKVPDKGKVSDVDMKLSIDDGALSDVQGILIAPSGAAREAFFSIGDIGSNPTGDIGAGSSCGATLTDGQHPRINDADDPVSGKYRPSRSLDYFNGEKVKGQWTLLIEDFSPLGFGGTSQDTTSTVTCNNLKIKRRVP